MQQTKIYSFLNQLFSIYNFYKSVSFSKYATTILQGDEELNAFKYNEEKTLSWLKKKTERVAEILKQKNIHVTSGGAISATFVKSSRNETSDSESYLRYAHGIVSEYLMNDLSQKLLRYLNLPEEPQSQNLKRKSGSSPFPESKKAKLEDENKPSTPNVLDLSKPDSKAPKGTGQSAKEKARSKAATGSKTISSFFKKT